GPADRGQRRFRACLRATTAIAWDAPVARLNDPARAVFAAGGRCIHRRIKYPPRLGRCRFASSISIFSGSCRIVRCCDLLQVALRFVPWADDPSGEGARRRPIVRRPARDRAAVARSPAVFFALLTTAVPVLLRGDADGPIRVSQALLDLGDAPWMATAAVIVP